MGINASKSINNVSNKIMNELEIIGFNASGNCDVATGDIILINPDQCTVTNQNRCSDDLDKALEAISKGSYGAWKEASSIQKILLIPGANISHTSKNIQELILLMLKDKCPKNSATTQAISESDLLFEGCLNASITNINAGSATANCAIKTIINTIISASIAENELKEKENKNPFTSLFGGIGVTSAILLLFFLCLVFSIMGIIWLNHLVKI
jgi:hypothetical protein